MPVKLILRKKEYTVQPNIPLKKALIEIGLTSKTHLAVRDGILITESDLLREGDTIKLV